MSAGSMAGVDGQAGGGGQVGHEVWPDPDPDPDPELGTGRLIGIHGIF